MLNTWFLVCWKCFFKLAHHGLNLIKLGISTTEEIKGVAVIQGKVILLPDSVMTARVTTGQFELQIWQTRQKFVLFNTNPCEALIKIF